LGSLWEHRPLLPPTEAEENVQIRVKSLRHELMVVMSPDCDLIWDFRARFSDEPAREAFEPEADHVEMKAAAMPHVLLCEAYDAVEVKARVSESRLWKNINKTATSAITTSIPRRLQTRQPVTWREKLATSSSISRSLWQSPQRLCTKV
jgi:hypothetical protein